MQCLILAGGLGTRMQHLGGNMPKALIPVNGKPFADYQLSWLASAGIERVVYALSHGADAIRDFVGDGRRWKLAVSYVEDGEHAMGTAGAIRTAIDQGMMDEGFFVLYGDSYLCLDLRAMWQASHKGTQPVLSVFGNDGQWDSSNVVMDNGRLVLYEKHCTGPMRSRMTHIDYGLSVLTRDAVGEHVTSGQSCDLADVYHQLSVAGQLIAYEATKRFYEVGSPGGLADLEAFLNKGGKDG